MERNKQEIKDNQPSSSDTAPSQKDEETVEVDEAHSSGILSITLHQAIELEVADQQLIDNKEKHPYNASTVVSPYALVYINDEKVFRTRSKMRNPSPVSPEKEKKRKNNLLWYLTYISLLKALERCH